MIARFQHPNVQNHVNLARTEPKGFCSLKLFHLG